MTAIKVYLRPEAMRMAAEWIDSQLAADENIRPLFQMNFPEALSFFRRLRKRGQLNVATKRMDIDRTVADRLVNVCLPLYKLNDPALLLQGFTDDGKRAPPPSGEGALAEIVLDIHQALHNREGRPTARVDPIETFQTNEVFKRTRPRARSDTNNYRESDPAVIRVAKNAKVSQNTAANLIAMGRDASSVIAEAKQHIPPGTEVLFALVDYKDKTVKLVTSQKTR